MLLKRKFEPTLEILSIRMKDKQFVIHLKLVKRRKSMILMIAPPSHIFPFFSSRIAGESFTLSSAKITNTFSHTRIAVRSVN